VKPHSGNPSDTERRSQAAVAEAAVAVAEGAAATMVVWRDWLAAPWAIRLAARAGAGGAGWLAAALTAATTGRDRVTLAAGGAGVEAAAGWAAAGSVRHSGGTAGVKAGAAAASLAVG